MARYVTIILISMEPDQIDSMIGTNLIQFLQTQERMAANIYRQTHHLGTIHLYSQHLTFQWGSAYCLCLPGMNQYNTAF